MIVLHYTGMATGDAALQRLCDPAAEVSCHYLVWEDGRIDQLVAEADRAWHAGRAFWGGEADINAVSIGIEIVNGGHDFGLPPFPTAQVAAVIALGHDICARRALAPDCILAHSDVAPDRKQDPGEMFPWRVLAQAGLGRWVEPAVRAGQGGLKPGDSGHAVSQLQKALSFLGFYCPATGIFEQRTGATVAAFQRHWRPGTVDGIADPSTLATLEALVGGQFR